MIPQPPRISPEIIKELILDISPAVAPHLTDSDTDLFEIGALDSYSMIQLVSLFEERLDMVFNYIDLRAGNFQNLTALTQLLVGKYGFILADPVK